MFNKMLPTSDVLLISHSYHHPINRPYGGQSLQLSTGSMLSEYFEGNPFNDVLRSASTCVPESLFIIIMTLFARLPVHAFVCSPRHREQAVTRWITEWHTQSNSIHCHCTLFTNTMSLYLPHHNSTPYSPYLIPHINTIYVAPFGTRPDRRAREARRRVATTMMKLQRTDHNVSRCKYKFKCLE